MLETCTTDIVEFDATAVLAVFGELDAFTSPQLAEALDALLASDAQRLIVDLADLRFIDSTGLSQLVHAQRRARLVGREIALTSARPWVRKILDVSGASRLFPVVDE